MYRIDKYLFDYFKIKVVIYFIILHNKFRISMLIYKTYTHTRNIAHVSNFLIPQTEK